MERQWEKKPGRSRNARLMEGISRNMGTRKKAKSPGYRIKKAKIRHSSKTFVVLYRD
jgi:hypothetical protein